jgi:geranylgeranyl diphosphate synthase, type II
MLSLKASQNLIQASLKEIGLPDSPMNLYDPIRYILETDGKRIRPALVLMGCNVFSDDISQAIHAAMAVEVFHNFTLMHDDIMDKSVMRRNRPAVHIKWDQNIAILSGDTMLIKAYELLSGTPAYSLVSVLRLFNQTALSVCEGQQYDMDFEHRLDITLGEYLNMVELKTAVLLAAALKIGAVIGGAEDKQADLLYEFGRNIGIAFQLQDDMLDVYGDPILFGKMTGNDIVSNKKTVLLVQALHASDGKRRKELLRWLKAEKFDRDEKIQCMKDIYNQLNLESLTTSMVMRYHQHALAMLDDLSCHSERKAILRQFSDMLMDRKK